MESNVRIWKFVIPVTDFYKIVIPKHSRILSVGLQNGLICLWAKVNISNLQEERYFAIVGTGNPVPNGLGEFIGTVQSPPFVWHIFEDEANRQIDP